MSIYNYSVADEPLEKYGSSSQNLPTQWKEYRHFVFLHPMCTASVPSSSQYPDAHGLQFPWVVKVRQPTCALLQRNVSDNEAGPLYII